MSRRLKLPLRLVFAVVAVGAPTVATLSCGSNGSPDASLVDAGPADLDGGVGPDAHSTLFCVPDGTGTGDAGGCPPFADQNNECPPGCEPVS